MTSMDGMKLQSSFNITIYIYETDIFRWSGHNYTGHHSPLFSLEVEKSRRSHPGFGLNTDAAINLWVEKGAEPSKLLLGS